MSKIALITGAAGFIGSHLCDKLLSEGFEVIGVDNFFRGKLSNLPVDKNGFYFYNIDLTTSDSLLELNRIIDLHQIEYVFHYAAINGTKYFYDIPNKVFSDNIRMTINVLNACQSSNIKKFIYASSSEVYGDNPVIPTLETHPMILNIAEDRDSYASSKAFGEFLVKNFCEAKSLDYITLRIFNTYGTRMDSSEYGQVIPEFIRKVLKDDIFTIIGDGTQTRSFCHVSDHTALVLSLLDSVHCQIVNVGNDLEISINDLAQKIHEAIGREFLPSSLPQRSYDTQRRCPSLRKIRDIIKIEYTPLEDGIREIIREYKSS